MSSKWIDTNIKKPPLIEGQDFSDNVWGWDGKQVFPVKYLEDGADSVWFVSALKCYYNITHWMPIEIPEPPKLENE